MLAGEPGIGKTRIASELAGIAQSRGAQVWWGWCYEGEGAPPYWPWLQPIRSYVHATDTEQLRSELGVGAADIAEVIPDLRDKLPGLESQPTLEPEQARFRFFDSIAGFLRKVSNNRPLVLTLEDLHWADRSSLLLLEFLARETGTCPLLLVATYRDVEVSRRHPLSRTIGSLVREPFYQRIQLGGMDQGEVRQMVSTALGVGLPTEVLDAVHRRTEGNPLFIGEVVHQLRREGIEEGRGWNISIPEGIRDAIGRRLDRLSEGCNQTLAVASVIGRGFTVEQLDRLIDDMSEERLMDVLEEASAAQVIEEVPQAIGHYQFTHALIQETLADELSTTRRVRLHARIGDVLEELYGEQAEAHAAELALHFAEAQSVIGSGKLVHFSLLAGNQALTGYAHEEAQGHFQRGLAAKEGQPTDAETATLLLGLGRAKVASADRLQMQETVACLSRAFDYFAEKGDVDKAVAAAEELPGPPMADISEVPQPLSRALKLVSPDSIQAGYLLSRYGNILAQQEGDDEGAQDAFTRALAIAQEEGDEIRDMRTLVSAGRTDAHQLRWQESLEKCLRAIELAHRLNDPRSLVPASFWATQSLAVMGDLGTAKKVASAALAAAERLRHRYWLAVALDTNGILARLEGDWQAAREYIDRGLTVAPDQLRFAFQRTLLEYEVGDFDQGESFLRLLMEAPRMPGSWVQGELTSVAIAVPLVARISRGTSHFGVAESAAAQTILSSPPLFALMARAGLGLMAAVRGDGAAAGEQYAVMELGNMFWGTIVEQRLLGLLAHTMGNLDQAVVHFEDALDFCRKAGYRPELAWACCDYADTLLQRNNGGVRWTPKFGQVAKRESRS